MARQGKARQGFNKMQRPAGKKSIKAIDKFREEVCDKSDEIDPDGNLDWYDMSIGFFLACGLSVDDATTAACWVRYEKLYWS